MKTSRKTTTRLGTTILELSAAAALVGMFLATSAQMFSAISEGERKLERRALGQQVIDNLAEQIQAMPGNARQTLFEELAELTPEEIATSQLPVDVSKRLPSVGLSIDSSHLEEQLVDQVMLSLTWKNRNGQPARPLKLTCWVLAELEASP